MSNMPNVNAPIALSRLLGVSHFRGQPEVWAIAVDAGGDVLAVRRLTALALPRSDALWIFAILSEFLSQAPMGSRFRPPLPGRRGNGARAERCRIVDTVELAPDGWRSWRRLRPELGWAKGVCWNVNTLTFDTLEPSATIAREVSSW
jgi:hypothetical protein